MYPNVRYSRNSAETVSAGGNKFKGKAVRGESCCVFKSSLKDTGFYDRRKYIPRDLLPLLSR